MSAAAVSVPASAVIDFSPYGKADAFDLKLGIQATGKINWVSPKFSFDANASATFIASTVYAAMPISTIGPGGKRTQGFDASLNPTGTQIIIKGYYDAAGTLHNISRPTYEAKGAGVAPKISYTKAYSYSGSSPAATTTNDQLAFYFAPNDLDGNTTLSHPTTVQATVDDVMVQLNESAGVSYLQLANDLYNALIAQGLQGVTNDGQGDVVITNNFAGSPAQTVALQVNTADGLGQDWINFGVGLYPAGL